MARADDSSVLGQFIPLHYHHNMLSDVVRMRGFKAAIDYAVPPGGKVLELGGGTGVLSYFAGHKAGKVWCVERNPELVSKARQILSMNECGNKIKVIKADAFKYLPPEPVDVVICEMIHVGMLREKQIPVINSFKERYLARFGNPLPQFVPEAFIQAVQPVEHDFTFDGFYAPIPILQNPNVLHEKTRELGTPMVYQLHTYRDPIPDQCDWSGEIEIEKEGSLNALRFVTKNILAVVSETKKTIDWHSHYLILPLPKASPVGLGEVVRIKFSYKAGASFSDLEETLTTEVRPSSSESRLPATGAA
jgi:protein arginine N-methyltransferase 1